MRSTAMLGSTRRHVSELAGWIRLNEIGSDDLSLTLHRGLPDKRAVTQVTYTDPSPLLVVAGCDGGLPVAGQGIFEAPHVTKHLCPCP
jgi:hypothetical protein